MKRVARAALFGLAAGLFASALVLGVLAVTRLHVDCATLGAEECTFERQLASSVARLQALGSLGCALVGSGLLLGLRGPRRG